MADADQVDGDSEDMLGQDEIEKLLSAAGTGTSSPAPAAAPPAPVQQPTATTVAPAPAAADESIAQQDVEYLLNQAEEALKSIDTTGENPPNVTSFRLKEFSGAPASAESATLDLIRDVELNLKIELGRTQMYLEDVLRLRKGSVVPLDKLAGDPVDIYVNDRLVARGEVLVLNDNFCVRVAELIAGASVSA
jgi:flagellar motor switch protein FliN/FliY